MKTNDLISRLAADQSPPGPSPARALAMAAAAAALLAAASMLLTTGLRPDFAQALETWRFLFKFLVTLMVAATGFVLLRRAVYPGGLDGAPLWLVLLAPALLLGGVAFELLTLPRAGWETALVGTNWLHCLLLVPAFGILPLAAGLWGIRKGASTRPMLTGFLCGLLSGGLAAAAYAANCPDDSPLFVIAWYPAGILALGVVGALLGRTVLRW